MAIRLYTQGLVENVKKDGNKLIFEYVGTKDDTAITIGDGGGGTFEGIVDLEETTSRDNEVIGFKGVYSNGEKIEFLFTPTIKGIAYDTAGNRLAVTMLGSGTPIYVALPDFVSEVRVESNNLIVTNKNAGTATYELSGSGSVSSQGFRIEVIAPDYNGAECVLEGNGQSYAKNLDAAGKAAFNIVGAGVYSAYVDNRTVFIGSCKAGFYEIPSSEEKLYNVYGFHLNALESNPEKMVSYDVEYDGRKVKNVSYEPAYVNLTNGLMRSGDWNLIDDFFIPRSCMLKYDGTVDYYLDEDDETKKADGTPSDVANTAYEGNAMMEWGRDGKKIWLKIVPDPNPLDGATFYIADSKLDAGFNAFSFIDANGKLAAHFYTPKYNGSVVDGRLRSLSGRTPMNTQEGSTEISYAAANNTRATPEWDTETWGDRTLINVLLTMIGKSCDSQTVFGQGYTTGGTAAASLADTGTLNGRGQWYGSSVNNDKAKGVKVFGMEHWWGNIWRRVRGLLNMNGTVKYKMTYSMADGTAQNGYDATGAGYKAVTGGTPGGTSGGYANAAVFNADGIFTKTASGSETTYFCDGLWFNNSQANYAFVGGTCGNRSLCGAFCVSLSNALSYSYWAFGASLSCRPLA